MAKINYRRQGLEEFIEAAARGKGVHWKEFKDDTYHATWMTTQFNRFKKFNALQIGGQASGQGPDILKFVKQWDSENSSGPVRSALDIMLKAQSAANTGQLMQAIKPIKQTLGADLFGKLVSAGAAAKASEKAAEQKPEKDMLAALIAAAIECTGEEADKAQELLDETEISKIDVALDNNGRYESTVEIPKFVECVNKLIPSYYAIQQGTA